MRVPAPSPAPSIPCLVSPLAFLLALFLQLRVEIGASPSALCSSAIFLEDLCSKPHPSSVSYTHILSLKFLSFTVFKMALVIFPLPGPPHIPNPAPNPTGYPGQEPECCLASLDTEHSLAPSFSTAVHLLFPLPAALFLLPSAHEHLAHPLSPGFENTCAVVTSASGVEGVAVRLGRPGGAHAGQVYQVPGCQGGCSIPTSPCDAGSF